MANRQKKIIKTVLSLIFVGLVAAFFFVMSSDRLTFPADREKAGCHNTPQPPEEPKEEKPYSPSGFHYDNRAKTSNAADEYNDRLDDYIDDPEDEIRFDPEVFDFQND